MTKQELIKQIEELPEDVSINLSGNIINTIPTIYNIYIELSYKKYG